MTQEQELKLKKYIEDTEIENLTEESFSKFLEENGISKNVWFSFLYFWNMYCI